MLRKITKTVGRMKAGDDHDYPRAIWQKIAQDAGMALDEFSASIDVTNPVFQSPLKGRPRIHRRLGGSQ